jgi:hypothetical protein
MTNFSFVIPGRRAAANPESITPVPTFKHGVGELCADRESRGYGFRTCALRAQSGMTNERSISRALVTSGFRIARDARNPE